MDKKFTTTNSQLRKLRQRGLIINDGSRAKKILERENYYNIINGYKDLFLDKNYVGPDEKFKLNTNFNELYALYLFDRELRNIYIRYILEIENNIKSVIAHKFSQKYGHDNYLKIDNFDTEVAHNSRVDKTQKMSEVSDLIATLQREISHQLKKSSPMISHYMLDYGYVPFWVLINTLSLGTVSIFFSKMKPSDQNDVARTFNLKPDELNKILFILAIFRNACAHDERFFNLKSQKNSSKPNSIQDTYIHDKLKIPQRFSSINPKSKNYIYGKNDLFAITIIFRIMLSPKSFNQFFKLLKPLVEGLSKDIVTIPEIDILKEMGFPTNWKQIKNCMNPKK